MQYEIINLLYFPSHEISQLITILKTFVADNLFAAIVEIYCEEPNTKIISISCKGWLDYFVVTILKFPDFGLKVWNA